jgi:hypothetical protein
MDLQKRKRKRGDERGEDGASSAPTSGGVRKRARVVEVVEFSEPGRARSADAEGDSKAQRRAFLSANVAKIHAQPSAQPIPK